MFLIFLRAKSLVYLYEKGIKSKDFSAVIYMSIFVRDPYVVYYSKILQSASYIFYVHLLYTRNLMSPYLFG